METWNLEREEDPLEFYLEQLSIEALWCSGDARMAESGTTGDEGVVPSPGSPPPLRRPKSHLDTHSCIQFIIDLFQVILVSLMRVTCSLFLRLPPVGFPESL